MPGVVDVHHLHVWGLSTSETALTAHLVFAADSERGALLGSLHHELEDRFGIGHATLQFESAGQPACPSRECHASNAD